MWQSASPHPVPFIILDGVRETNIPEWALSTQRLSNPHRVLSCHTIREVLGEKNLWNVLTRRTTVSVNRSTKIPVCGLSVADHNLILLEDNNE